MLDLRFAHAPDHLLAEPRGVPAVPHNLVAEDLCPDLLDGLLGEEREGVRDRIGRDPVAIEAKLLHGRDLVRELEVQVLPGIKLDPLRELGLVDEVLGEGLIGARGRLGLGADDDGGPGGRRGEDSARHCVFGRGASCDLAEVKKAGCNPCFAKVQSLERADVADQLRLMA